MLVLYGGVHGICTIYCMWIDCMYVIWYLFDVVYIPVLSTVPWCDVHTNVLIWVVYMSVHLHVCIVAYYVLRTN